MRAILPIVTLGAAVALSACNDGREAGATLNEGDLGGPTANNILVMTGDRAMAIDLTRRFAAEVPSTITFDFDSAELDESARAALDRQAAWIQRYPFAKFRVYGHTDKAGSSAYNKSLGLRRAQAAVAYLISRGISRSRLEAVVSLGETQPLIVTEGRERRNRRTVTEVSGFVQHRPMVHDGNYMRQTYRQTADVPGYVGSAREEHKPETP